MTSMDDYQVPYSYEIKELGNGMFKITITATGFLNSRDAERFMQDIHSYEFEPRDIPKPTLH